MGKALQTWVITSIDDLSEPIDARRCTLYQGRRGARTVAMSTMPRTPSLDSVSASQNTSSSLLVSATFCASFSQPVYQMTREWHSYFHYNKPATLPTLSQAQAILHGLITHLCRADIDLPLCYFEIGASLSSISTFSPKARIVTPL
jgi:hypothetical protein